MAWISTDMLAENVLDMIKAVIGEVLASVSATAERLPGTAFVMVQPIMRPA